MGPTRHNNLQVSVQVWRCLHGGCAAIADQSNWNLSPDASYVYYCDNETIDGQLSLAITADLMWNIKFICVYVHVYCYLF